MRNDEDRHCSVSYSPGGLVAAAASTAVATTAASAATASTTASTTVSAVTTAGSTATVAAATARAGHRPHRDRDGRECRHVNHLRSLLDGDPQSANRISALSRFKQSSAGQAIDHPLPRTGNGECDGRLHTQN